jgi:hypothetical protein
VRQSKRYGSKKIGEVRFVGGDRGVERGGLFGG